jgi:hypothetical protein
MILSNILNFSSELSHFTDTLLVKQNYFSITDSFLLLNPAFSNSLFFSNNLDAYNESLVNFMMQTQDLSYFDNLENLKTTYHYSIPNVRLSYPEPFIASPSFIHSDL